MDNGLHCRKINSEMISLRNLFRNVSSRSLNRFKEISKSVSSQQTLWVGKFIFLMTDSTTFYHGQTAPTKRRRKQQQNNEAQTHKWLKTHNTLRTKTGIEGTLKHSIREDAEIEYSSATVYSVFLKTLANWKVADVVTIPDSLGINDTDVTDLAL